MHTFVRYALVLSFTACVATLYLLSAMATDYANPDIGRGLHPAAAVVASVVVSLLGVAALRLALRR